MFPILPVLLLLLFQGPSGIERLSKQGRLPAGLDAVRQELARNPGPGAFDRTQREKAILDSWRAAGGDPNLSNVLFALLRRSDETPLSTPKFKAQILRPQPLPEAPQRLTDGFVTCRRTRDGP